jgi:hypothetical protein
VERPCGLSIRDGRDFEVGVNRRMGVRVTVEELMERLAALPPKSKVLVSKGPGAWSFLQASQVNLVTALWNSDAVLLGEPLKDNDAEMR